MSQRLSKPIMLCQRMSSGRIHIRITSLANGSRKILIRKPLYVADLPSPEKTKTAICGRPDRFQASKDPNQYPLDEIFLGRLPHITEIIFLKCQKLPHIGHFKLKTRHRHITFFVRSKTAFRKRHHHRRRGYRFCGGRVRAAIRRVPYRRAHGCRDATACAFRPPPR